MKAYLIEVTKPVEPFNRPASSIRFRKQTVRERLVSQLRKSGCKVVHQSDGQSFSIDSGSLVLRDDVLISDNMIRHFLAAIPSKKRNYQLQVDVSRFPMLTPKGKPALYKAVPIYFYGQKSVSDDVPQEILTINPKTVYKITDGVPAQMHELSDLHVHFTDLYAIHLEQWYDIQVASCLYSKELVAKLATPVSNLLPEYLSTKVLNWRWMAEKVNIIGKNCRIHPTAVMEGCIIGDNVEIGPFTYLRSSVVANNAAIREKSSVKLSYIGEKAFIMGSDIVSSYVGAESSIIAPMLYHVVFGERSFISGGSGFADFNAGSSTIKAMVGDEEVQTHLNYLGSCVGDDCFIGANMIFAPGRAIPDGTKFLDHGLLKDIPKEGNSAYVLSRQKFLQIPKSFFGVTDL